MMAAIAVIAFVAATVLREPPSTRWFSVAVPNASADGAVMEWGNGKTAGIDVMERVGASATVRIHNRGATDVRVVSAEFTPAPGTDAADVSVLARGVHVDGHFYYDLGPFPEDVPGGKRAEVTLLLTGPCDWRSSWGTTSVGTVNVRLKAPLGGTTEVSAPVSWSPNGPVCQG